MNELNFIYVTSMYKKIHWGKDYLTKQCTIGLEETLELSNTQVIFQTDFQHYF